MKCVLVDPYAFGNLDRLRRFLTSEWELATAELSADDTALSVAFTNADAAISQGWNKRLGAAAPGLRYLQVPNAGTDAVDWSALPAGCQVCNVFEHEVTVAEFAILAILELAIGLRALDRSLRKDDWSLSHRTFGPRHGEIAGTTLGIIGYGRIGNAIAGRAAALGMQVVAVSRRRPQDDRLGWAGDMAALDDMLPRCDFVVVACPLDETTRGLIGRERLGHMGAAACLVNVARAEIVDERALYEALRDRDIGGAALDVWWRYPAPGETVAAPSAFPYAELDNVVMTPHVAGWSENMLERRWKLVAENLDRFAGGLPLRNPVHRPLATGDAGGG